MSDNPKRKLKYTLEQVYYDDTWLMVHTGRPNEVVAEAIEKGLIAELTGYEHLQREKKYGLQNSRIDILLLEGGELPPGSKEVTTKSGVLRPAQRAAYVEVKSVTLKENGVALFPDSVSVRGTKHLRELMEVVRSGHRGVLLFHVSRNDCEEVQPAGHLDPVYARTLAEAATAGVEILAYRCEVNHESLELSQRVRVSV